MVIMESFANSVTRFDDLIRCYDVFLNDSCEKDFLRFVANKELVRLKCVEAINETKRLKTSLDKSNENVSNMDRKLLTARRMLDKETQKRKKIESEREMILEQLENVKKILFSDNRNKLPDETKEKLSFLRSIDRYSLDQNRLNTINEFDIDTTSASNLSDISYSRSEDDLDDYPRPKVMLKHRPSYKLEEPVSAKRRRSVGIPGNRKEITTNAQDIEHLVATTTVTVQQGGPVSAKSVIEKFPSPICDEQNLAEETPKGPSFKRGYRCEEKYVPSAPTPDFSEADDAPTPKTPYQSALEKINGRTHTFIQKTVYMPETCAPCGLRIGFGNKLLRCTSCHIVAHIGCRDKTPLPCVPMGTPSKPGVTGFIQDYTPLVPPMIPAIVIHCVSEVEQRGLSEMGIYRVPGADKEVRGLKEKFLRGKGAPDLSQYDIHTICSCLKDFLRSLQDSLIPQSSWLDFAKAVEKGEGLYEEISMLPQPNRDTLAFIILHLQLVASSPNCKMPISNLAKVWTFALSTSPATGDHPYSDTHTTITIVESLLSLSSDYWSSFIVEPPSIGTKTPATLRHTPSTESLMRKTSRKLLQTPASAKRKFFAPIERNV